MANEDRFLQDANGQAYFKPPGARSNADLVPVTPRQIEQLTQGGLSTLAAQAGDSLAAPVSGALVLGERAYNAVTGEDSHRFADTQAFMDQNRQTRAMGAPIATLGGDLLGMVPDAALAAVTGGATAGARIGTRVGVEALAQGGMGALRTPDDPLMGALLQGGLGGAIPLTGYVARGVVIPPLTRRFAAVSEHIVNRSAKRAAREEAAYGLVGRRPGAPEAGAAGPRSLSAAQITGPTALEGERVFGKSFLSGDEMGVGPTGEGLGFPMSPQQKAMIDAPDMASFQAAREADVALRERAAKASRIDALKDKATGEPPRIDYDKLYRAQQEHVVIQTASELGIRDAVRLTPKVVGERMKEIGGDIEQILADTPDVKMGGFEQEVKNYLRSAKVENTETGTLMKRYSDRLTEKMNSKSGVRAQDVMDIRNEVTADIEAAAKNDPNTTVVKGLTEFKKQLDKRLMSTWDAETKADYFKLGRQWDIAKALHKGTDAMGPLGDVELNKFMNAFRQSDHLRKTGRSGEDPFLEYLETAQAIMTRGFRDSGTSRGVDDIIKGAIADTALSFVPGGSLLRGG